jgi:hypothetical protein
MKITNLNFVKLAAYVALVIGLSASALASCGDSLSALATSAAAVRSHSKPVKQTPASSGNSAFNSSIVGLWHVQFIVGDETIQEAYQLWNAGGTEIHNPNVDPRTGNVCLGVWKSAFPFGPYKLAHRVWNYDATGDFGGTINLSETVTVGGQGNTQSGTFALDFYDPSGNFLFEVDGTVTAERISVD